MADPAATPPVPENPFTGGGTERNIDQQKAMLNDLIAMGGQYGKDIYARQAPETQQLLVNALGNVGSLPQSRKAVYDSFIADAAAAEGQQARTAQRQAQLGNIFMDQAKAAVPVFAKNVDATTEAMRLQFEERRRREEEQAANARAASAASIARSQPKSVEQLIGEKVQDQTVKKGAAKSILEASGVPKDQWSTSDVLAAGLSAGKISFEDAARALGFGNTATALANKEGLTLGQQTIDELFNGDKDVNFAQVQGTVNALIDAGVMSKNTAAIVLMANAPRWGFTTDEYGSIAQRYMRGR